MVLSERYILLMGDVVTRDSERIQSIKGSMGLYLRLPWKSL
jgi:hypothetical protein